MIARRKEHLTSKAPAPEVIMERGRLVPVTAFDAEILDGFKTGQLFRVMPIASGENRQMKLYRKILNEVAKSTERWPTGNHLHNELRQATGYTHLTFDKKTGTIIRVPDSTSSANMNAAEFNVYFNAAMKTLAEAIGFDPMEVLKK